MTHPLVKKLTDEHEKLVTLVKGLEEEALDRRHGDGWTIREVLTHLVNAEEDHCRVISVVAKGELHRLPSEFNLNEHNARRVAERGHMSRDQLLEALDKQRARTLALLERMDEADMEKEANHPALGEITIGKIFRVIGIHERMHHQDIVAALEAGA